VAALTLASARNAENPAIATSAGTKDRASASTYSTASTATSPTVGGVAGLPNVATREDDSHSATTDLATPSLRRQQPSASL